MTASTAPSWRSASAKASRVTAAMNVNATGYENTPSIWNAANPVM
jgi:hypothetical protein